MTFDQWLEQEYPDGMGNGFGGSYSQSDMYDAWLAGRAAEMGRLAEGGSFK